MGTLNKVVPGISRHARLADNLRARGTFTEHGREVTETASARV